MAINPLPVPNNLGCSADQRHELAELLPKFIYAGIVNNPEKVVRFKLFGKTWPFESEIESNNE